MPLRTTGALCALAALAAAAEPPPSTRGDQALALCHQAERASAQERAGLLDRGLALAVRAVHADEGDARAHFAVFCNLGEQMRSSGIGLGSLIGLRRLRNEIDRTLALAPEWPDALLGKGALLLGTPWLLGGDRIEGERLVRRALAVDPDYTDAHLALARALAARDARAEAAAEAQRVLTGDPDPSATAAARALLAELRGWGREGPVGDEPTLH